MPVNSRSPVEEKGICLSRSKHLTGVVSGLIRPGPSPVEPIAGAFGIMMAATLAAGIMNYGFNIIMTRLLPRDGAFGEFYSLSAIFLIVAAGAGSLQAVITRYVAVFEASGETGRTRYLLRRFSRGLLLGGALIIAISMAAALPFSRWLQIDTPLVVPVTGLSIAVAICIALPAGLLQGRQQFISLGAVTAGAALLRIVFGVALVLAGLEVYGALGAPALSGLVVFLVVVFLNRAEFTGSVKAEGFKISLALKYLIPVTLATFLLLFLTQVDSVMAKALFSPGEADLYACAALAGKAVLFLPDGIALVMFPRVSSLNARGRPTGRVLVLSLLAALLVSGLLVALYALFPVYSARFFAGERVGGLLDLQGLAGMSIIVKFGLVMAVFAAVKVLVMFQLALGKKAFTAVLALAAAGQVAGIMAFHRSPGDVLSVMLASGLVLLAVNLVLSLTAASRTRENTQAPQSQELPGAGL